MPDWFCHIQYLKGVGPKRGEAYRKLGVETVYDLLHTYPRTYLDLTNPLPIADCPFDQPCAVVATVVEKLPPQRVSGGLTLYKIKVTDGADILLITYFNSKFSAEQLMLGEPYVFFGKVSGNFLRREMKSPLAERVDRTQRWLPVYSLTAGLSNRMVQANVKTALETFSHSFTEVLPDWMRAKFELCHLSYALQNIHFPQSEENLEIARTRLAFEELFLFQMGLALLSAKKEQNTSLVAADTDLTRFYQALPFDLTPAQRRVIGEALEDMKSGKRMNRLIQGDVGSGKTLAAAGIGVVACQNGWQVALMVPTEILAEQHFHSLSPLMEKLGIPLGLLTGSMGKQEKDRVKEALAQGDLSFVIGTHALIQEDVEFAKIGLVITDEQHRFGVRQRAMLGKGKGEAPHTLVMSATPIPRTLALMLYGDLDVSIIDQLPVGRKAIQTYLIDSGKRQRAYGFIQRQLDQGRQAYLVCPLIEEGEEGELHAAQAYYDQVRSQAFVRYRVGLLHGKLPATEKDQVMRAFARGELDLLVATTVIEVGVDVPNATVMLIENAERFGLSQLHQLRGRIGRGEYQSTCILVSDNRTPETRERLKFLCGTCDGFRIAEYDLRQRGPGDFFGSRQHGALRFKIADVFSNMKLLEQAKEGCVLLLSQDPQLREHPKLAELVKKMFEAGEIAR